MRNFYQVTATLAAATLLSWGCGFRPARVPVAQIDYGHAAVKAIESYDRDTNGSIESAEAEGVPALKAAFKSIDANSDSVVTREEIADYLQGMQRKRVAMVRWTLRLQLDGKPLEGATVKFEPAGFLLPGVLPADGVTDNRGIVTLSVPEEHRPSPNTRVIHCGLYNVYVSKVEAGRETLPEDYASGSVLGVEVRPEGQTNFGLADIRLSSSG